MEHSAAIKGRAQQGWFQFHKIATITPETGRGRLYTGYPEKVENKIKPKGPG